MSETAIEHELRDKMCRRFLIEICGRTTEITEEDIRALDDMTYKEIVRPLVIRDAPTVSQNMLANRYGITRATVLWMISK